MTKKLKRVFSLFLAILMVASMPLSASAAFRSAACKNYKNKTTVSISKSKNATYEFRVTGDLNADWSGEVEVEKGGKGKKPSVTLTLDQIASSAGIGKVRYMRITMTTSDGKTQTIQKKWEYRGGDKKTKVTTTTNGKAKVTYEKEWLLNQFWYQKSIDLSGKKGTTIKSIYVSANYSGGSQSNTYIYFKG